MGIYVLVNPNLYTLLEKNFITAPNANEVCPFLDSPKIKIQYLDLVNRILSCSLVRPLNIDPLSAIIYILFDAVSTTYFIQRSI